MGPFGCGSLALGVCPLTMGPLSDRGSLLAMDPGLGVGPLAMGPLPGTPHSKLKAEYFFICFSFLILIFIYRKDKTRRKKKIDHG
jgi:hypothetical protein